MKKLITKPFQHKSSHKSTKESGEQPPTRTSTNMSGNLPKSFKAGVFEKKDAPIVIKDVPLEPPKPGEVLIKTLACGVCHSDVVVQKGLFGNSFPIIPGHEVIGNVVAVGEGEKQWKVGDRVGGAWHGGHDGTCRECKHGQFQMCQNGAINGVTRNGGYGEYCTLRTEAVVKVPKDVDPAVYAPILCAGITVFNSLRKQHITAGDVVAVQGLGGLGHLALQYSNNMGYRTVAISSSASKEKFARELGAHDYVDGSKQDVTQELQKLGGAACVVFTAPNPKLVDPLLKGLAPLGKLLVLAAAGPITVDTGVMIHGGLSVAAWPSGHAIDSEEAIEFAQIHGVNCMIEKFKLDDADKAIDHMTSGKVRFRSVLVFEE